MAKRTFDPRVLPITSAVATALLVGACSPSSDVAKSDVAVCRDAAGVRVDDAYCARGTNGRTGGGAGGWYYIGRGGRVPAMGEALSGGYTTPRAGVGYARASSATVSRGGFGMSARGFGGGAGE
ncbi:MULTISPECIES: hypothetical protein [unclassified Sphingomonas]|jgi:hypothetical protein|uniref:hypothetical protein n=1 Tax=unclassified Sphingomonas TaxID=196159 RepID=UPI0010F51C52|nr:MULTISPECIES: hypothetical protein [unclassified Sphingomonas]MDR6849404.1 hypothetical protein [Sphingomonas sp. BE137]